MKKILKIIKIDKYLKLTVRLILILFTATQISCVTSEYNYDFYAKIYCKCLEDNSPQYGSFKAHNKCDSVMIYKNKYFKEYYEDLSDNHLFKQSNSQRDSISKFMLHFWVSVDKYCTEMNIKDTVIHSKVR